MVSSTIDSGLMLTVGIPKGDMTKPDGNPVTLSTVSENASVVPPDYQRVEQDDSRVTYSGNWVTATSFSEYSGGSAAESTAAGDEMHFNFTGSAVRWIGHRDSTTGIADVFLDGVLVGSVDTYSTGPMYYTVLFSATGLAMTGHTLTVQVEGQHNPASSGSAVWVDAFDVSGQTTVQTSTATARFAATANTIRRIEQNDAAVSYSGSWSTVSSSLLVSYSGGSAAVSSSAGSQATLNFNGTGVSWIGYQDTFSGIADVVLDGSTVATVDSYALLPASQVVLYSVSGLASTQHTLTIRVRGDHQLLALGSNVTVDAFDVQLPPPDTIPPTVSITEPANGATVSGNVTISADAADNVAVAGVQFMLDGASLGAEKTTAPYSLSWNTANVSNGAHQLSAMAWDTSGNSATSVPVSVTVSNAPPPDTTPPTVAMTAPANGATVSGNVTVSANASDNVGVVGVQFQLDGANLGAEVTIAPYSITWNSTAVSNGSHALTAIARDAAGNKTTATPVSVTVSNGPPPDTTPPTVSITAPANGATVSGSVTVSANASDNVAVAGVQFELNGSPLGAEDTSSPYAVTWNTTAFANGSYTLTAVASDTSGNSTTSSPVTVTVNNGNGGDTTPPAVSMTAPTNGATVSGNVTVSANASDNVGVVGVQFMLDGTALGAEDTTSPYSISWDSTTATNGSHTLTAVARDAAGNHTTSSPVTVTVSNSSGGTTTRIEQDNPAVTYTGTWVTATDPSVSGGTAAESNQANATATLTFSGTAVTWIGYKCSCAAGIADVSVDGGPPSQVDNYSATTEPQAKVFTVSNLPKGTHTLKITVTGTFDRNGSTAYVVVDAFDVTN